MIYKGLEVPFKESDFACKCGCGKGFPDMSEELLDKLFRARARAGVPFIITSGFRCEEHNRKCGGKPSSAHLRGMAVDVKYPDSRGAYKMLKAFLEVGFVRLGKHDGQGFFHVDCDRSLPQEVFFKY